MWRRIRDAFAPRPLDESLAWTCLAANLLVLPGLGSLMARRRAAGSLQAALSLGGTALAVVWLVDVARLWMEEGLFPQDGGDSFGRGLLGVAVFGLGWLWSLGTSLMVLRAVRRPGAP